MISMLAAAALLGCVRDDTDDPRRRGRDIERMALPANEQAAAYAQVLRESFDLPGTTLLLDPRLLPAGGGYAVDQARLPDDVGQALLASRTIAGQCIPETGTAARAPSCPGRLAGYAVRFSDLFQLGGDTVRVYVVAERFRPTINGGGHQPSFRMEERYDLTFEGSRWRVARKARMML
jgi:hypothetical protein